MNKDKQVRFRLEDEDWNQLQKRAEDAGMSVSKYLRFQVIREGGDMTISPKAEQQHKDYFANITRLGNNENQLVREINSDMRSVSQQTENLLQLLNTIKPEIAETKSLLKSLVRQIRV
jgi:hypothetical protein